MMNREAIYSALFAKLKSTAGFKTASRRLLMFTDVPAQKQPALFMTQKPELVSTVPGQPSVSVLTVDVTIYAKTTNDRGSPASVINPLVDAIQAALAPNPITNKCTLGDLVQHCYIDGTIETDEGVLGSQGVAIVPITMKVVA